MTTHCAPSKIDKSPLLNAAAEGNLLKVKQLEQQYNDHKFNSRALAVAAKRGHHAVVEYLIARSNPKAKNSRALMEAVEHGHVECVKLLLPHSNSIDQDLRPLFHAAHLKNEEMIKVLVDNVSRIGESQLRPFSPVLLARQDPLLCQIVFSKMPLNELGKRLMSKACELDSVGVVNAGLQQYGYGDHVQDILHVAAVHQSSKTQSLLIQACLVHDPAALMRVWDRLSDQQKWKAPELTAVIQSLRTKEVLTQEVGGATHPELPLRSPRKL